MATKAKEAAGQSAGEAQETATDAASQATSTAGDASSAAGDSANGLFSELKDTASEAALAVLKPVVKDAAQSAANYAVSKGPDLLKGKLDDIGGLDDLANTALSKAGPVGKVASKLGMGGKLVDNVLPGGDEDEEGGEEADADATGSGRRMPVQQAVDVAVPLEVAYNQWTQFEEYPNFMHRVDSASQEDDANVTFTEKMWNFSRDFKAEIVEQRPNERIVWRSVNGLKHAGVVTFHQLAERLTRIEVTVDFMPQGFFEKIGRGARFSKRAIRADMHRFKAYVEMKQEEDGSWLGEIDDGEVVKDHEQAEQERAAEAEGEEEQPEAEGEEEEPEAEGEEEEPEAEGEEEEAEEEEEPQAEEEEEPEAEEEPQAEEEEEPEAEEEPEEPQAEKKAPRRRTAQTKRKTTSSDGGQRRQSRRPSAQRSRSGSKRRSPQRPKSPQRRSARASAR
jgi:uncharacterized membrane protein